MVIWGAIWGAVLGLFWRGYDWEFNAFCGTVLGAIAGFTLRRAVRTEMRTALASEAATNGAAPDKSPIDAPHSQPIDRAEPQGEMLHDTQDTLPMAPEPTIASALARTAPLEAGPSAQARLPSATPAHAPAERDIVKSLYNRARDWLFGGNTVVRMGVLVLFIGLAFLAKYAVENALLPPELRMAAIAAAGIVLFVAGYRLRGKGADKLGYAFTLQGAGVAVLYLSVFSAFRLYQFLPAGAAFAALGMICAFSAVIALAQNAQSMAFIGFAGGFAAPILVSTGQGNHVGLFAYYMVLGVFIAAIGWMRAWRSLNLLGFFATFGVATLWGALNYRTEQLATTEPFLVGFFAIYLVASLLYALRHVHSPKQAVDATLIFGVPVAAFGLQAALVRDIEYAMAFSALVLGALYLTLGWWLAMRSKGELLVNRWLAECFAALGLGFVTLAVPLALDGNWTSAVWAVEGAGVYWMGRRQGRWLPRAAGLVLQGMAGVLFLEEISSSSIGNLPFGNPQFVGATLLAAAALAISWWSRNKLAPSGPSIMGAAFRSVEATLSPALFWVGFLWWQFALTGEIHRAPLDVNGMPHAVFSHSAQLQLQMVAWVGSAFVLHHLALAVRTQPWRVAATPVWTVMPAMLAVALWGIASLDHVFQQGGWVSWTLVGGLHLIMLRRLDAGPPQRWWPWVHAGGVWLLVLLAGNLLVFAIDKAALWQTAWATVLLLTSGTAVLFALARRGAFAAHHRWPLSSFSHAYLWRAALPLAVALGLGAAIVALHSDGDATPLPYVPLINPTDLSVALALAACTLWLIRVRESVLAVPAWSRGKAPAVALAAIAFLAINTVWLRVAHHWAGVPWDADVLFESFLVQAGYSILWTVIALGLMVAAHRRTMRNTWILGAGLLGLTVFKLFVIDLSNRGGTERIFVFIAVGMLMLIVGWLAPLPPIDKRPDRADAAQGEK